MRDLQRPTRGLGSTKARCTIELRTTVAQCVRQDGGRLHGC